MKAILMAAGRSTRTYPLTVTRPKPLLKIANKPILAHQIEALKGIVEGVVVVVGYRKEMIQKAFGDSYQGMPIEYAEQDDPRGTGHALLQCEDKVAGSFIAMNGDDIYDPRDIMRLLEVKCGALAKEVAEPSLYGVYDCDSEGTALALAEKPEKPASNLANMGVYRLDAGVFDVLRGIEPSERGELEITSALSALIEQKKLEVVTAEGYWLPIGYPWHLLEANEFILNDALRPSVEGEVSSAAHLHGIVVVGRGTTIRPGVVIDGPVIIGRNCSIGPNCWLRPGTTIGDNCKVGQGCEIKNSILFDGAAVPHLSYVGDSIIGENTNLGCGAITANYRHDAGYIKSMVQGKAVNTGRRKFGTIIGDNVHTGINTCIYPGRKLWPNASTLPGEIVRKDIETETD